MRIFTICLLLFGFGLFLTGETWLWFKKSQIEQSNEKIDYRIQGDSIQVRIPIAIPYLNQSIETKAEERIIFVDNAYFLVTRTYFAGDTLFTEGHRIQPSRQEIFSILGQLVQLEQAQESSPIDQALDLFKQLSKFYHQSFYSWTQWFWTDLMMSLIDFPFSIWDSLPYNPLSPPPCLVN